MSSGLVSVDTLKAYRKTCLDIARIVMDAKRTERQDATISTLSTEPSALIAHAEKHALELLQDVSEIAPTYVMMSKAGDGVVVPIILTHMPSDYDTRISIAGPLSLLVRLAPIDCYYSISSMWGAPNRAGDNRRIADRPDRMPLILIRTFNNTHSHSACYTRVRHPETDKIMGLYPFRTPIEVYETDNPCLMNFYELADTVFATMSAADITKFRNDILNRN
jgi:hypothetical protein